MLNFNDVPHNSINDKTRIRASSNELRPGQLIKGKVLEIYPKQKATIQFAGKQIVAKLETALNAKQSYFFQVTSVDDMVQLKKISEVSTDQKQVSEKVLQQLGLPNNRSLKAVIQQLANQQIPFTTRESLAVSKLMETFGQHSKNRDLMIQMMKQNLPITELVFQSLQAGNKSQLGSEMRQLYQLIQQMGGKDASLQTLQNKLATFVTNQTSQSLENPLKQFLRSNQPLLQTILTNHSQTIQQIMTNPESSSNKINELIQDLNSLLQKQLVRNDSERNIFRMFTQRLKEGFNQKAATNSLQNMVRNQPIFQKVISTLSSADQQVINQWLDNKQPTTQAKQQVLAIFERVANLQLAVSDQNVTRDLLMRLDDFNPSTLSVKDRFYHMMKHFIQTSGIQDEAKIANTLRSLQHSIVAPNILQSIQDTLSASEQKVVQNWLNNTAPTTEQNNQLTELLRNIKIDQLPKSDQAIMRNILNFLESNTQSLNKDQLIQMMRQLTNHVEQDAVKEQNNSLKQQLLLVSPQSNEVVGDRVQRLIHSLTGSQLNMVDNDQLITQQNVQIPGDRFGLVEDINMQFEGKKNSDNKEIDPDYCRILFQLQLAQIGETYISLSIQKRVINITVYNDTPQIKSAINYFSPTLKEKLESLDYRLTAITQKSIEETNHHPKEHLTRENLYSTSTNEGIDFRV